MTVRLFCKICALVYTQNESSPSRTETGGPAMTNRFTEMNLPQTRLGVGKPNRSWGEPDDTDVTVASDDSVCERPPQKNDDSATIEKTT
ncbi:hypothetical protein AVEN_259820-1 [Araneus ventricosus]|uniref:Uncharacterized protein n=1 Tax=Araneus ventricosus TaxID=182803 RepID=A0A4Y2I4N6_ARAVE|nr:hypothetical protein AVEN_259820-1 [Araneus ventricosus]